MYQSSTKLSPGHYPGHPDQNYFRKVRLSKWSYWESNPEPPYLVTDIKNGSSKLTGFDITGRSLRDYGPFEGMFLRN